MPDVIVFCILYYVPIHNANTKRVYAVIYVTEVSL